MKLAHLEGEFSPILRGPKTNIYEKPWLSTIYESWDDPPRTAHFPNFFALSPAPKISVTKWMEILAKISVTKWNLFQKIQDIPRDLRGRKRAKMLKQQGAMWWWNFRWNFWGGSSGRKTTKKRGEKRGSWKAKGPSFKATGLLVLGVKLPRKIGHKRRSRLLYNSNSNPGNSAIVTFLGGWNLTVTLFQWWNRDLQGGRFGDEVWENGGWITWVRRIYKDIRGKLALLPWKLT